MHSAEGVAGAGQTAAGAVGEEAVLAVLTLRAGVPVQAGALAGALLTFVWVQDALGAAAAVARVVWEKENTCKYAGGQRARASIMKKRGLGLTYGDIIINNHLH